MTDNKNLHRLVEALYNDDKFSNVFWWDFIGSVEEAKKVVANAYSEQPDQKQLNFLIEILEIDTENEHKTYTYNRCLNELRKELIQVDS